MPLTNYLRNPLSISLVFLIGILPVLGQERHAQPGMTTGIKNLTTFPVLEVKNLNEWKTYNGSSYYSHPDFGKLPENAPCTNCVEVLEKRTIDERYFVNLDDEHEFYVQKALGDLHQSVNGKWLTIDHTLHPVSTCFYIRI